MYNLSIQALRGVAALLVVLSHSAHYVDESYNNLYLSAFFNDRFGLYGVTIFFIISGYLIASCVKQQNFKTFALHRIFRIYPLYFIAIFISIILNHKFLFENIDIKYFLLLPMEPQSKSFLTVEWTLAYEVFFYLVSSFFCNKYFRNYYLYFLLIWLVFVLGSWLFYGGIGSSFWPIFPGSFLSVWNVGFILGGIIFYLKKFIFSINIYLYVGICMLLFSEFGGNYTRHIIVPLSFAFIFIFIIFNQTDIYGILLLLGDCSYALYLIHVNIIYFCINRFHSAVSHMQMFFISLGFVALVALFIGIFDRYLYKKIKSQI